MLLRRGIARRAARKDADERCGTIDVIRTAFHTANPLPEGKGYFDLTPDEEEARDALWKVALAPYRQAEEAALAAHPQKDAADPACEECKGTGKYTSTRNPKSKWDWWVIGGRWDGVTTGGPGHDRNNPAPLSARELAGNVTRASDLAADSSSSRIPYALVTPDGEWHARGQMGWFGMSSGDEPRKEWETRVRGLYAQHQDALVVGVDCHI